MNNMNLTRYTLSLALLITSNIFGAASGRSSSNQNPGAIPLSEEQIPSLMEFAARRLVKNIKPHLEFAPHIETPIKIKGIKASIYRMLKSCIPTGLQSESSHAITRIPVTFETVNEAYLRMLIATLPIDHIIMADGMPLKERLYDGLAQAIASDYLLRLSQDKEQRQYTFLPAWLQPYFSGVSIQDLNNRSLLNGEIYQEMNLNILDLRLYNIADLAGLDDFIKERNAISIIRGINFEFNNIVKLTSHAFAIFSNLRLLNLDTNKIRTISHGAFAGLSQLEILKLRDNELTTISCDTFGGLTHLFLLSLGANNLTEFCPGTFAELHALTHLYLWGNPVAENQEERARIEQEVRIATNGQAGILWES